MFDDLIWRLNWWAAMETPAAQDAAMCDALDELTLLHEAYTSDEKRAMGAETHRTEI